MVDGLKGFCEAITAVFPLALVQTCVVHLIRPALAFVSYKDRKAAALKKIYKAKMPDWQNAMMLLRAPGGRKIPPLLAAEGDAVFCLSGRWIMDTTNAIERLNAKLRRAARGPFPTDERAPKLLFLVLNLAAKAWKMPPREGAMANSPARSKTLWS
jgi:putative transposase